MTTNEQVFADKNNKTIKMNSLKIKDTEQLTIEHNMLIKA